MPVLLNRSVKSPSLEYVTTVISLIKERANFVSDFWNLADYFFQSPENYDEKAVKKHFTQTGLQVLKDIKPKFEQSDQWNAEQLQKCIHNYSEISGLKLGKIAPPLRIAVCGSANSPSIDVTLELIGKDKVISRIDKAISYIESHVEAEG